MAGMAREARRNPKFQSFVFHVQGPGVPAPDLLFLDSWIRRHFRYRPELYEVLRTPEFMLNDLETKGFVEGDCDDISIFYAAILRTLGYEVRFVAIRYSHPELFEHVFIEFENTGRGWVRLDPTAERGTIHEELERMVVNV